MFDPAADAAAAECIEDIAEALEMGLLPAMLTDETCAPDMLDWPAFEGAALEWMLLCKLLRLLIRALPPLTALRVLFAIPDGRAGPPGRLCVETAESSVDWGPATEEAPPRDTALDRVDCMVLAPVLLSIESTEVPPAPGARLLPTDESNVEPNLESCRLPMLVLLSRLPIDEPPTLLAARTPETLLLLDKAEPTPLRTLSSPGPAKISDVCD